MKPNTFTFFLLAVALVPAIAESKPAQAQVNLSQLVTGGFNAPLTATQPYNAQANIVISVRDFSPTDDFCGNSESFSFAHLGSLSDGFDFPHAGRQSIGFPHPGRSSIGSIGSATTYFQLPTGVRNPDLIGCVDTQRHTVFITIKPQSQAAPIQPQPPQPEPSLPPAQTPSMQTPPSRLTPTVPQTQIRLPQQSQSFPAGVSPSNQPIR